MNVGLVWELREEQCFAVECVWESYERVDRGSVRVVWELLREILWEHESCWERRSNILCIPRDLDQTKQEGTWPNLMGNRHD